MAKGFQYRDCTAFPELAMGEILSSCIQLGMPGIASNTDGIHSSIEMLGVSEHLEYSKYHVSHDMRRRLKYRFHDEIWYELVAVNEFPLYLRKDGQRLIARTNEDICDEFLNRLQRERPEFRYAKPRVDLKSLKRRNAFQVSGAWFGNLEIPDLRAAAIYGPNVGNSDEWMHYENSGDIRALNMDVGFMGEQTLVSVTAGGGVVIFRSYEEREILDLVCLVHSFIAPFTQSITDWLDPETPA